MPSRACKSKAVYEETARLNANEDKFSEAYELISNANHEVVPVDRKVHQKNADDLQVKRAAAIQHIYERTTEVIRKTRQLLAKELQVAIVNESKEQARVGDQTAESNVADVAIYHPTESEFNEEINMMMLKREPQLTDSIYDLKWFVKPAKYTIDRSNDLPKYWKRECEGAKSKYNLGHIESKVLGNYKSTVEKLEEDIKKRDLESFMSIDPAEHITFQFSPKITFILPAIKNAHEKAVNFVTNAMNNFCEKEEHESRNISEVIHQKYADLKRGIADSTKTFLMELNAVSSSFRSLNLNRV